MSEKANETELSRHYTAAGLIRFAAVPILTITIASLYMIVDALFIANFTSSTSYAASNLATPYVLIFPAVGFMVGGGGNALIGKLLGEKKQKEASDVFSMLLEFPVLAALAATVLGMLLLEPFLRWNGADGLLLSEGLTYGRIVLCGTAFFALQYAFQLFLITSGEEVRAFVYTVIAGAVNIGLDALLILVLKMGVAGAAVGTILAQVTGGALPLTYYCSRKRKGMLIRFRWTRMKWKPILDACVNGISEMVENLTQSLTGFLYNMELMRVSGEAGVDAYGSLMYAQLIFTLAFVGFNESVVPLIAYHYGADNRAELRSLFRKSIGILFAFSVVFFAVSELLAVPVSALFSDGNTGIAALTVRGFRIGSFSLIFMGAAMFIPSLFTALNNGLVSGGLTVFEMLVFPAVAVLILSRAFGMDGIWHSLHASWILSALLCAVVLYGMKGRYPFLREVLRKSR